MKAIATDKSDFEELRKAGQIYVDKTAYFHRMVTDPSRSYFFCARPRRFGKSLGVTTLKSIFLGHREFFADLAIAKTGYDFAPHTVVHFNWGGVDASSREGFDETFPGAVADALTAAGYAYDCSVPPSLNLSRALTFFKDRDGKGCVILIDEYDDPVAKSLADVPRAEYIRDRLATIYAQFKDNTDKIRFLFITGVSKFTKLSIFSTLSSLNDISFDDAYADMLGYTEEELDANFAEHMSAHAAKMGLSDAAYRAELKRWFNGYRFARKNPVTVYNPVSINLSLVKCEDEFRGTWTQTGRPSMLMNFIRREGLLAIDYEKGVSVGEDAFDVTDIRHLRAVAMLYQTGYLTISDYADGSYTLNVPDEEVRRDLLTLVAAQSAEQDEYWVGQLRIHLIHGEFELFFRGLKAVYAHLPYDSTEIVHEMGYERCLKILLQAFGLPTVCEDAQSGARADVVAFHRRGIFVFELKRGGTAQEALDQIRAKGYAEPYFADGRPVYAIGLGFDAATRHLVDAAVEQIEN